MNRFLTLMRSMKKGVKWQLRILLILFLVSFFSPLITNNKPIYFKLNGAYHFPAFNDLINPNHTINIDGRMLTSSSDWQKIKYQSVLWAPLRNGAIARDLNNQDFQSPLKRSVYNDGRMQEITSQHILGTDRQGHDVFAQLLSGIKYSLMIGLSAILLAATIGIILGAISGFYQNVYKIGKGELMTICISLLPAWFYGFSIRSYIILDGFQQNSINGTFQVLFSLLVFIGIIKIFAWLGKRIDKAFKLNPINFPIDNFITGITEIFSSVPSIIIVVTVAAISGGKSTLILVILLSISSWPAFARITRGEVLRIKGMPYIESATALGIKKSKIITNHILINAMPTLTVAIAFGFGSILLAESALSFLNIGVPDQTITLGALLRSGREHIQAWWLIVFPGATIFLLIYLFNQIGDRISAQSNRA